MDGPVTNKPSPVLSQAVKARTKPVKCRWDEHLAERKDGTKVCLEDFGAGESTAERIPARFLGPERVSTIRLDEPIPPKKTTSAPSPTAPPPPAKPQPAVQEELKKLITGKAEYRCKTRMSYLEEEEVTRDISISAIPNESAELTSARLGKAARELANTIHGCFDVQFVKFLPAAEEAFKAKPVKPAESSSKEVPDRCAPGGEWEHRSVCRK